MDACRYNARMPNLELGQCAFGQNYRALLGV